MRFSNEIKMISRGHIARQKKLRKTSVDGVNLPKGWSLVDGGKKQITGTNASVVTHILMFNPLQLRLKREGFKGTGVGSVVGGKPLSSKGSSLSTSSSMSSSSHSSPSSKIIGTQTVGTTLHTLKSGDKHDSDLVDLNQRNDQKMAGSEKMKAGSVRGSKSNVDWKGRKNTKNGKKYQPDEKFEIGNLRYKCQKYGVYTIEGCKRKDGTEMKLGESVVVDNVKHQCLGMGSSVFYKETTCGVMGQPECDKIPLPKGFEEAQKRNGGKTEAQGKTSVDGVNLPKGWSLVDGGKKQITGTNASVVTHILMFTPLQLRLKREGFKGAGVGSVVGVESMSADQIGKPLSSKGSSSSSSSMSSSSSHSSPSSSSSKIIGTQTVGATLHTLKSGDKHDSDLVDLNQRNNQKMAGSEKMKAGSVHGSKSNVDWKGRKVIVNGKTVGAGEGTFSFGNKPTVS
ncbi:hypothetical protein B9Z55_012617 [Caenorhabditis nigoni]|uniref:Abnormal cell migration protein 18-like fibronectin type I domain-containing protein n=1 Tax=Caenorhabditis nigoni TaxID=1611254 RepID=A0A2G5TY28_9PELO|nr:hypothetical protein B9Z55_012617 [Caenorhabditis nigoni]